MEELLNDFLAETADHLDQVGAQIVHFEQDPSDKAAIANIFRLVHTIKGTCGFLELARLEKLAHAAETLISLVRDEGRAETEHVTLILASIDRIRMIVEHASEKTRASRRREDSDLIAALNAAAAGEKAARAQTPAVAERAQSRLPMRPISARFCRDRSQGASQKFDLTPSVVHNPATASDAHPRSSAREPSSIRVAVGTLERIMRLVSELVLARNQLLDVARRQPNEDFSGPLQRLSSVTSDLQDGVMHARMQPIERLFGPLPRMIRDLAHDLGKKAELILDGSDTELDRQMIDLLRDPLTHIIRNCLDHGLELPHERLAAGKTDHGIIRISASHEAGHIRCASPMTAAVST
jgi:two-component system chemotaxis sensor kinase CheA